MSDPSERELADELAARFQVDVGRARRDVDGSPLIQPARTRSSSSTSPLGLAFGTIVLVALLGAQLVGGQGDIRDHETAAPTAPAAVAAGTDAPSSTSSSEPIELVDGLPAKVDGVVVLRGEVALAAIREAAPGDRLLIGGWLFGEMPMSCPALRAGEWWNPCNAVGLHETAYNGPITFMYRGAHPLSTPLVPTGQTGPIVLSVHTHDASCPSGQDCNALPVVDAIAWFGAVVPVPSSFGDVPSTGVSRDRAIELARAYAGAHSDGTVELVSSTAGPYGSIRPNGGEVSGDRWVWAIVFAGRFPAPGCGTPACTAQPTHLVILDYVTGNLIVEEEPA